MDVEYIQKKIEDSLFDFVDKILNYEGCSVKSRIKYYNEITSFVEDNVVSCEFKSKNTELEDEISELENMIDECRYTFDNVKSDAVNSFQDILHKINHVDNDSIISMINCIDSIETIAQNSIREIDDYLIEDW